MKTVLHVVSRTETSGVTASIGLMARGLRAAGWQPQLAHYGPESPFCRSLVADGVPVSRILAAPAWTGPLRTRAVIANLSRLIAQTAPAVVHAHSFDADLIAARALRGRKIPLLVTVQSFSYAEWVAAREAQYRRHGGPIRWVVCVCEALTRRVASLPAFAGRAVTTLYNTPHVRFFEPVTPEERRRARQTFGFGEDQTVIVCVANYHPVKGHATLARAFARLAPARPEARLLLVGAEAAANRAYGVKASVEALLSGLADRVHFETACPDVRLALVAADLYVQPSDEEALSVALCEALACGLPAVATQVGGNPELVQDGVNGAVVPRRDDGRLAAALDRLIEAPGLRKEMGERSRRWALDRLLPARTLEGYARIYADGAGTP
ncbi:MAG: glycosyltransferase family 4 protein [Candidatus Methylomirabilales bacterium]